MNKAKMALACALALGASLSAVSDEAGACGNGVERRVNESVQAIANAERMVEGDATQIAGAARAVLVAFPAIDKQTAGRSALGDRAMRVMARAIVRMDGALAGPSRLAAKTPEERAATLQWAIRVLRTFHLHKPKDAVASTDLGEALAHGTPAQQKEALHILASLEKRDVMSGARGYAALSRLRVNLGEDKPAFIRHPVRAVQAARARIAASRCRNMTKDPSLCGGSVPAAS